MLKRVMIGLIVMSMALMFVADTSARVCVAKVGGKCVLYSGSLVCGIDASGIGSCDPDDPTTFTCTGTATTTWLVACGNPGTNNWTAPGINLVYFEGQLAGAYTITGGECDKNGHVNVTVVADPDANLLQAAVDAGACPNQNWTAIDAVPCNLTLVDREYDSTGCLVSDATFDCYLPDCATLEWDSSTQHFESRQYECTRTDVNTYTCP